MNIMNGKMNTKLNGQSIYIIHNNKKPLACTVTTPVTIFAFTKHRLACKIQDFIKTNEFVVSPTLSNSYIMHKHEDGYYNASNINIEETTTMYLGLLRNLNGINVALINEIRQQSESMLILNNDPEGLPYTYTDIHMIIGNLEKIYSNI